MSIFKRSQKISQIVHGAKYQERISDFPDPLVQLLSQAIVTDGYREDGPNWLHSSGVFPLNPASDLALWRLYQKYIDDSSAPTKLQILRSCPVKIVAAVENNSGIGSSWRHRIHLFSGAHSRRYQPISAPRQDYCLIGALDRDRMGKWTLRLLGGAPLE